MALTVIIEVLLAIFSIIRLRNNRSVQLGVGILLFLALFQAAEYGICEQIGFGGTIWAQIGFASITMLPVLGMHLISTIAKLQDMRILLAAYLSGAVWIGLFAFGGIMENQVCSGNYVIFNLSAGFGGAYFMFYYFWLVFGSIVAIKQSFKKKVSKQQASALRAMVLGYASFTVPATLIWFVFDGAAQGLPSIMCGFAVIFALILGLKILPTASKIK